MTDIQGVGTNELGQPVLLGSACTKCATRFFPAAPVCPHCMSEAIAAEPMPRAGTLYSFTIVHTGPRKWPRPMTCGYVDLTNGVRVYAPLRGTPRMDAQVTLDIDEVAHTDAGPEMGFVFRIQEA